MRLGSTSSGAVVYDLAVRCRFPGLPHGDLSHTETYEGSP